ncbi:3-keto-disaccharide hydrolase [Arundinibacter roseus]|uniref:DUF1080 domain-containing protein n=1 Tax=Arundinibacter roseus TaxID=2070510 RepID=A0A4R4KCM6_9BACT|nr:DUF1080 domain-containing protein [Arundinibacter roseus]TDB64582.1 DUF1080 domain-containing protein [Arundinibacter roseus]
MYLLLISLILSFFSSPIAERISLFDGKTFTGWEGDVGRTWQIKDGALTGGSLTETVAHNEFLTTTRTYKDFTLDLEFKLVGTGFVNAGVQFRSRRATDPAYEMIGYQADLGKGYWGCLYDESRRNKVLAYADSTALQAVLKKEDWNTYKISCKGNHIQLWINGLQTVNYKEPDSTIVQSGLIGLQIHGGGKALVQYRNLFIEEH